MVPYIFLCFIQKLYEIIFYKVFSQCKQNENKSILASQTFYANYKPTPSGNTETSISDMLYEWGLYVGGESQIFRQG